MSFTRDIIFSGRGPTEENVVDTIVDDEIALEDHEIVTVGITVVSPNFGVNVELRTTVVTIIDDDRKLQIVRQEFSPGVFRNMHLLYYLCSTECFPQQIRRDS